MAHLTKAQLTRKRANDRVAQQNIRQRNKEHIAALEKKVMGLEEGMVERSKSINGVTRKNQELEAENEVLRAVLAQRVFPEVQMPLATHDEQFIPQKCASDRTV